ncbi:MAG: hypothetical protein J7604_24575 [Sporocytophaga sp.]|uniref:hypothetical protein n=1 Tax=Sporocytophaga sp. TaxID=2231183 RepID=UPI001B083217|nr:hypothetical protein [Sporocytophaga sp.]MBO9703407.1 hypothetical protein [Sporocytophaga sp.]
MFNKNFLILLCCIFWQSLTTVAQEKKFIINSAEIINEGVSLHDEGKFKEAIEKFKEVDRNDTNYVWALAELSLTYIADSQFVQGIKIADEGLSYNSKSENHFFRNKGVALDKMGKTDEAIKLDEDALKKYPWDFLTRYNCALAYEKKSLSKSMAMYKDIIVNYNPYHPLSHYRLSTIASDEGKLAPYMLASYMYLVLKPGGSNAFDVITKIEKLVKGEINLPENKDKSNYSFADLETIIESKVALNSKYKHKVKLNYPFVSQTQLFLEKLEYKASDTSIWMQQYVPFFVELNKKNYLEPFVYTMLSGLNIPEVQSWLKKNQAKKQEFFSWASNYLSKDIVKKTIKVDGKDQKLSAWYYDTRFIHSLGNYKDAQNTTRTGHWIFYYPNTVINAEGNFDSNGNKTGEWKYYYDNGSLKEIESYNAGKSEGPYKFYYPNGAIKYICNMSNGSIAGDLKYHNNAEVLETVNYFKDDKLNGSSKTYFNSGNIKSDVNFINGLKEGKSKDFNNLGAVVKEGEFKNGKYEGAYKTYHNNGKIASEGLLKDDKEEGVWNHYYDNGKQAEVSNFKGGKMIGSWKKYSETGILLEESTYNEKGNQNGEHKVYDTDGKLHYILDYKDGKLKGVRYFDKTGKLISENKEKGGVLKLKSLYPDGVNIMSEGTYKDGERDGVWKYYELTGVATSEENYKAGVKNGPGKTFYLNGKKDSEFNYKDGALDGFYQGFYTNGKTSFEGYYVNDRKEGYWYRYYPNGKVSDVYYYLKGEEYGVYEDYSTSGHKRLTTVLKDGVFAEETLFDTTGKAYSTCALKYGTGDFMQKHLNSKPYVKAKLKGGSFQGDYQKFYPNGKLKEKYNYIDGLKHGPSEGFAEDGKLEFKGNFYLGKKSGIWKYYYSDGKTLSSIGKYVDGSKDSLWVWYNEDGTKNSEFTYKDNNLDGQNVYYSPDGKDVILLRNFKNDVLVSYNNMKNGASGTLMPVANETAQITGYYSNGNKAMEFTLDKSMREGKCIAYYSSGKKWYEKSYQSSETQGPRIEYYADGKVKEKAEFFADELNGLKTTYYPNGNMRSSENYILGVLHGVSRFYDVNGKLVKEKKYVDGWTY